MFDFDKQMGEKVHEHSYMKQDYIMSFLELLLMILLNQICKY